MAGALLLAYAVAFPAPVQAQSTDAVWSTTMTVGVATNGNRGFYFEDDPAYDYGSMGVDDFTVGAVTYDVWYLSVTDQGRILFLIQVDGSDTNLSNQGDYFLEWAGEILPLSAADGDTRLGRYEWQQEWVTANAPSLAPDNYETTLPDGGMVRVCLRTATQICPKAPGPLPWSTTMTVGEASGEGTGRGYFPGDSAGALEGDDFTVGVVEYEVRYVGVSQYRGQLHIAPALLNKDDYILEVAGAELPLASTTSAGGGIYYWSSTWLASNATALDIDNYRNTLPIDGMVQVCLRRTTTQVRV